MVHITIIHRDGSACTTLKRVPGSNGQLVDKWVEFYIMQETEKEFYLRNRQVLQRCVETGSTSIDYTSLVPRPLSALQCWVEPGDEARLHNTRML